MRTARSRLAACVLAAALAMAARDAPAQEFHTAEWGSGFSNCAGARTPVRFKVGNGESDKVVVSAIAQCRDDGDAYTYTIEYANFVLPAGSEWKTAHFEWFGAAAQKAGTAGRNNWIYDEVRPIAVNLKAAGQSVAVANLTFRIPKATLSQARGFGFYAVGGGVFFSLTFQGTFDPSEVAYAPQSAERAPDKPADTPPRPGLQVADKETTVAASESALAGKPAWGASFRTCEGAKQPEYFKAAGPENEIIRSNGIVACTDAGDSYVYDIEFMMFSLAPGSPWKSVHLEWMGAGIHRTDSNLRNDWLYDEAKPIRVEISPDRARSAVTKISFKIPKTAFAQARGFGFYVTGGGILWSIFLL